MRGGLRGFAVFIACIALGVAAIAGVGSFARSLGDGLAREGRGILGGDVSFSLSQREAARPNAHSSTRRGSFRRRHDAGDGALGAGENALVEIKAVDAAYPLFGTVGLEPAGASRRRARRTRRRLRRRRRPALFARLNLERGARITVGGATIELRAALAAEPDKLAGGIGFGPRLMMSEAALRATGLLQPGSLVRWHYRLKLPDADANDRAAQAVIAASERAASRRRLGDAHPRQCLARARPQHRALHPIPDAGRPHRAAGRRRRRRQRGEALSRSPPRHDRHPEVARRDRRPRVRDLSDRGDAARRGRHRDRACRSAPCCRSRSRQPSAA